MSQQVEVDGNADGRTFEVRLHDFKSFVDVEVALAPLTVLLDANASGKSNLLDAIRFLRGVGMGWSLVDVLRGRWEGGQQTWPNARGGPEFVSRWGEHQFGIQSDWTIQGETITHRIQCEVGRGVQLARESLTSSKVANYLFDTHAPALRETVGRDAGSIRVALKRDGKGNSPTQTHGAERSLLHQLSMAQPVSTELARVRDRLIRGSNEGFHRRSEGQPSSASPERGMNPCERVTSAPKRELVPKKVQYGLADVGVGVHGLSQSVDGSDRRRRRRRRRVRSTTATATGQIDDSDGVPEQFPCRFAKDVPDKGPTWSHRLESGETQAKQGVWYGRH